MLPERISFTKLSAGGNDFICLDNTMGAFDPVLASSHFTDFVRRLCQRGLSVGADGVIMACGLGDPGGVDIVARFLEPDGSEAELCGNGTACFTYWAITRGLVPGPHVTILTAAGTASGQLDAADHGRVRVCVPDPTDLRQDIEIELEGKPWRLDYVHTGVPHAIVFVDDVAAVDVPRWGGAIRRHPLFQPRGVNANFVEIKAAGHLIIRTFEFGVEAETLACGTGSAAAAIVASLRLGWPQSHRRGEEPVLVDVRGGETLRIWFTVHDDRSISDVCLQTRARAIYDAELRPEFMVELLASFRDQGYAG